ncbi:hypothetical protein [Tenacibaculum finnmarkense]|uniref:hypothetical protein n=1 Tax=Tenacibaculum finnmarkense TaxID=2781243 RepID=UPI001E631AB9|nr:hypothetical protein [Tenacibaculum finnmarkense]MCD8445637.1 hypothetical protein [Tenacibaculum finnmarkense genomovar ulcerans]
MKKNFRVTPEFIRNRINAIDSDNIIIATIIKVDKNQIEDLRFRNLNLQLNNNQISFNNQYIPENNIGSFSRKNIDGYKIVHKDQDKIRKSFYLGERPYYGDWSKGSFSLYATRKVYPSDNIPPRELSITTELLEETQNDFKIKVSVDIVLNRNDDNFDEELFFTINLLQENIHSVNVFSSLTTREEYLRTLSLTWDIFPPGERNEDLERIMRGSRNLTPERIEQIQNKYDYLINLNPVEIISGLSGMRKYFGAKFSENLVVFENLSYGNAIYVLFENWVELSQMSRTEIQTRPDNEYIRIKHTANWEQNLEKVIAGKR